MIGGKWNKRVTYGLSLLVVALVAGCDSSETVEMKMGLPGIGVDAPIPTFGSISGGNFYANGFPTDLRVQPDGSIEIDDFPRGLHWVTDFYTDSIADHTNGYHTIMPVYLPFTGAFDIEALSEWDLDYTVAQSPIQIVDVDPLSPEYGRRFPVQVTMTTIVDSYRPNHLLQIQPTLGVNLRPNTTYAAIVTDQTPVKGDAPLVQSAQLSAVLNPTLAQLNVSDDVTNVYAPLRNYMAQQAIAPETIVGATVWTTGDPFVKFYKGAEMVVKSAEALDTLPISELDLYLDYPDYCVVRGFVDVPGYQKGFAPYFLFGGDIEWDENGTPVEQYTRSAEFVLTIPKHMEMPEQGYPLLSYIHGAGGRAHQVYDRGEFDHIDLTLYPYYIGEEGQGPSQIAAERGWASSGLAGHLSFDHIGRLLSLNGAVVYNLFNPVGLYSSYFTMAWERIYFRRIVDRIRVDTSLCADANPGEGVTEFKFDTGMQVNMGQSQGHWVSSLMVAADPKPYQGVIFTGAAGTWTKLYNNNFGFTLAMNTAVINRLPFQDLDDPHPFLMLMEWLLGSADATANLDSLMRYPSKTPPHVIGFSGYRDYLLSEDAQRPLFMTVGSDLAGDDIGSDYDRTVMPHMQIAGAKQLPYPVSNNFEVPGYGLRTNVVTRHQNSNPVLLFNGHEIIFQQDEAKHQYGCFLEHLASGRDPVVDLGYIQGGPCL